MRRKISRRNGKKIKQITAYDVAVFDVLHAVRDFSDEELAKKAGLRKITVRRLRNGPKHGGTRYPRHITFTRLLKVANKTYVIRDIGANE